MKKVLLLIFVFILVVYLITSPGNTPFNYFTRLADAFLHGRYYITENPSWLSELIPAGPNKFYIVYPPMPAILAMPFVLLFKNAFQQQYLAHLLGAGITVIFCLLSWKISKSKKLFLWTFLFAAFGNIIWFLSSVGSSWYLGQISAAFFISLAILEATTKKRPFLLGVLLGAAYLSRIHLIFSFPFFLYALKDKFNIKNLLLMSFGALPFAGFNFIYNFVRFQSIFDQAYFILPKILNEQNAPWFAHGVANPIYIPDNLRAMFLSFPKKVDIFPFIEPSWAGLAIWITSPAFVFALFSKYREGINQFAWLSIFTIFLIVASHGGTGWAQFGYRFAVDFYPFLIYLTIKGVNRMGGPKKIHWLLLILSILVNLWGVLWINKFGWVTF